MNEICCFYFDEEIDQDIPSRPENLEEIISIFRKFQWRNREVDSTMKMLVFKSTRIDNPSLYISCLKENKWCLDVGVYKRRKYMGPFFKKCTILSFLDLNKSDAEKLIHTFFISSAEELESFLDKNESGLVVRF